MDRYHVCEENSIICLKENAIVTIENVMHSKENGYMDDERWIFSIYVKNY